MKNMFKFIINLIYPSRCVCCNEILLDEKKICEKCNKIIVFTNNNNNNNNRKLQYIKKVFSPFIYDTCIRNGIFNLKFSNMPQTAPTWACLMYNHIINEMSELNIDIISFIPMYNKKYKKRGYNQSELLAVNLSKLCQKPMVQTLYKTKNHIQLHNLNFEKRKSTIIGTFGIFQKNISEIKGKNILLIDDVITTGSTLCECAKVLKSFGGLNIYALTIAAVN